MKRNDLTIYERHATSWWDPASPSFRSLHAAKRFHSELLMERWADQLNGAHLVDLGCGGGLLSVPLLGRIERLTAVDLSPGSLAALGAEANQRGHQNFDTRCIDLCNTGLPEGGADLVTLSDVIEHVPDPQAAVREAARILRPGGQLFVNTLNKTTKARWLAVHLAETLRLIPPGTHDPTMFVSPEDLVSWAQEDGFEQIDVVGESPRLWTTVRRWAIHLRRSSDTSVSYSAFLVRSGQPE